MIIGKGLIAKAFVRSNNFDNYMVFASGVSNSLEEDEMAFEREAELLTRSINENPSKTIIYFSTCSIYDPAALRKPYARHKLAMEKIIKERSSNYFILRLTNIVGSSGNKNTIINYFVNKIINKEKFIVWKNATRNILDIDDLIEIVHLIMQEFNPGKTINISNLISFDILFIVRSIEKHLKIKGNYITKNIGIPLHIDTDEISHILNQVLFSDRKNNNYLDKVLRKYY